MPFIQNLLQQKDYFINLLTQHITLSLISILAAAIIGIALGIFIYLKPAFKGIILNIINILYTIPSIAMLGFMIAISGIGKTTAILALTLYGLLPMVRATVTGLEQVDSELTEAAAAMGSRPLQTLKKVQLPLATPFIASGFRNMVVMTIALAGISAFIGAGGLGEAIFSGITTNNRILLISGSALVSLLALSADFYFAKIEKWIQYIVLRKQKAKFPIIISVLLAIVIPFSLFKGTSKPDIIIGAKPQTEQYILNEILKQTIESHTDLKVELTGGIGGGTSNIHPAIVKGEIDMYPEYTGTSWLFVLKNHPLQDQQKLFEQLQQEYLQQYGLNWYQLYGFNNTFTLVIRKDFATEHGITTFSQLTPFANGLRFGAEFDFYERDDGFEGLKQAYQFNFKDVKRLDVNLKYQAFDQKDIDVMLAFTTDAQINNDAYTVLIDDRQFFPSYYAGTVIRQETLEKYPALKPALDLVTGAISNEQMAEMNYQVDVLKKSPHEVARQFIEENIAV